MRRIATMIAAVVLTTVMVQFDLQTARAQTNDHFASRRRDAELRRQQALQAPALRPWGGPTTPRSWWTPVRGTHRQVQVFGPAIQVPGRYVWIRGRLVYVPWRYRSFSGPQHIHIERIIRN